MPVYNYKGFNAAGKAVTGTQEADSPRTIKQLLKRDGIFLTDLVDSGLAKAAAKTTESKLQIRFFTPRISSQALSVATRQLATLVNAGIPLVDALTALIDQVEEPYFKNVWSDVKQRVNEGASFGDVLGQHPRIFSGLYVNMVKAGETSGALDVVLNRLADFTESQAELRSKLIGTMVYPIIMLVMSFLITGLIFVVVIPKISKIFEVQKAALPLPTQILIGMSNVFKEWWFVIFLSIFGLIYLAKRFLRSTYGRAWWDKTVLNLPIFGPLVRMIAIARFTKTLGTLMGSGVQLLTAFDIVKNVMQNTVLLKAIEVARDCVKEGESIAAPLKRSQQFPPIVTHMIAIGEKSGQLEEMLGNVARSYEVQIDSRLRAMTSLLEPLILVILGGVVFFIVISILMPMLQISSFA